MAVPDDLRRLSQMDSIFLGWSAMNGMGNPVTGWHKGRLQQANDGSWIFRSISQDGSVVGYQLGPPASNWSSDETPAIGVRVFIPIIQTLQTNPPLQLNIAMVLLQQQLAQELIN
jgi:hypothetical protein